MSAIAIQYLLAALNALPAIVQAGGSIIAEIESLTAFIKQNADPTPAQWAAQNTAVGVALANLMAARPAS
jgi:hypothetical protein